jgi:hypothetical protein
MVIESLKIPLNPEIATDCTDGDLAQDPLQVGFALLGATTRQKEAKRRKPGQGCRRTFHQEIEKPQHTRLLD